ncbi:hypothetical protein BJY01DRAFT_209270 [Aspergillus pseudoustus]|uniref:Uncharacterized protein n=1 Tax=Aspergillus pseudoustus TaxID=1810923 RepID=A0ABR4KIL5_9EURO
MSDSIPLGPLARSSQDTHASTDRDRDYHHDRPPSIHEHEAPPDYEPPKEPATMELHPRSYYALFLAVFYAALVLAPWVIICLLTDRPIGGDRYGARTGDNDNYGYYDSQETQLVYERSERWFRAARVIQAIASVLTLPLTSAICASAAVIFMQRQEGLTVPQLMSLADRGWLDWATYGRVGATWKRFGSSFLLLAMLVNLLGMIVSPLQSIFLTSETVKTPTRIQKIRPLIDLASRFYVDPEYYRPDNNLITIKTRAALETTDAGEKHAQIWPGANVTCDPFSTPRFEDNACQRQGVTMENISALPDPFLAELPNGFHTGLLRQFLPRINSTAQYEVINETDFPANCGEIPDAFYVEYTNTTAYRPGSDTMQTWGLKACMPANVTQSPWLATRDRHSFSEVLYLGITSLNYGLGISGRADRGFFRVTLSTTTGYFELPNYMNGGVPGVLLEKDPTELCDDRCESQGTIRNPHDQGNMRRDTEITPVANSLQNASNKGPLFVVAMALFGSDSFIDRHARHREAYASTITRDDDDYYSIASACRDLVPFGQILKTASSCIYNNVGGENGDLVRDLIANWLGIFYEHPVYLANAFTAAAYLSHKVWMEQDGDSEPYAGIFGVGFDMGVDRQKPIISLAGIVVVSVLLGIHVLALLVLGAFAAWSPRWTRKLDSFAVMRIGGSIAQHVPLWMVHRNSKVKELDTVPGWIGDQMPESESVGMLGLGGPVRLRANRKYIAYHFKPKY